MDELIRQWRENRAIRIFKGLNYLGVLKSLKPLMSKLIAEKKQKLKTTKR